MDIYIYVKIQPASTRTGNLFPNRLAVGQCQQNNSRSQLHWPGKRQKPYVDVARDVRYPLLHLEHS